MAPGHDPQTGAAVRACAIVGPAFGKRLVVKKHLAPLGSLPPGTLLASFATTSYGRRSSRSRILELLKRHAAATVDDLSRELKITPNAVRQQLALLQDRALVRAHAIHGQVGRPRMQYMLTEEAEVFFPKRYDQLANWVLREIAEIDGPAKLDQIFVRLGRRRAAANAPMLKGKATGDRLRFLAEHFERQGAVVDLQRENGTFKLDIHNCFFRNVARNFPQVCRLTTAMISELTEARVRQVQSIHNQDHFCSFVIEPRTKHASGKS